MADENPTVPPKNPIIKTMHDDATHDPVATPPPAPSNIPVIHPAPAPPAPEAHTKPSPPPHVPTTPTASPLHPDELLAGEHDTPTNATDTDPFAAEVPASGGNSAKIQKFLRLGIGVVVLFVLIGLGFFYGQRVLKQFRPGGETPVAQVPDENNDPSAQEGDEGDAPEPSVPISIFSGIGGTTKTVESPEAAQVILASMLLSASSEEHTSVTFVTNDGHPLPINDLFTAIGLNAPDAVREHLNEEGAGILLISDNEAGASRLAVALKISGNSSALLEALTAWEPTMYENVVPLYRLLSWSDAIPQTAFATFTRDDGITVHYANVSGPSLALDYAIDENRQVFIYATSRESMDAVIASLQ